MLRQLLKGILMNGNLKIDSKYPVIFMSIFPPTMISLVVDQDFDEDCQVLWLMISKLSGFVVDDCARLPGGGHHLPIHRSS